MSERVWSVPELLDARHLQTLRRLLERVLPYPAIPDGPTVSDTVAYVLRRLEHEDRALFGPLEQLLERTAGSEDDWLQAAASTPQYPDRGVFEALRGWAWDGFLADPRWGVNRGGRGWTHLGWGGPPRRREAGAGEGR